MSGIRCWLFGHKWEPLIPLGDEVLFFGCVRCPAVRLNLAVAEANRETIDLAMSTVTKAIRATQVTTAEAVAACRHLVAMARKVG